MKICVTAVAGDLSAEVDPRFGRCKYFVFVDSETTDFEAMPNEAFNAPGGAGIQAAETVVNKNAEVLVTGNVGPNAFQVLSAAGVKIATGAFGTVKEVVEKYKSGGLNKAAEAPTVPAHSGQALGSGVGGVGSGRGGGRGGGRRGGGRGRF